MTNYTITNDLFVVNADNVVCGGPYKNDESAKRRVRDLKRKEAEAAQPIPPGEKVVAIITGEAAKLAEIVATTIAPALPDLDTLHALANRRTMPDAAKLAASSAYGKTAMLAGLVNGAKATVIVTHSPYGTTPAGVYPAIGKSERRKRWNYA